MAFYPYDIYNSEDPGFAYPNVDDPAEVNSAYMNYRDYEIRAIEEALRDQHRYLHGHRCAL